MAPLLIVLAGPNGAGKSTFHEAYLAQLGLPFLNTDLLAATVGLASGDAARQVAAMRDQFVARAEGFILETVLSDPVGERVEVLAAAAAQGLDVVVLFIGLASSELCIRRVRSRAAAGGHDVPADKLRARYPRTLANLGRAIERLPNVMLFDNSSYRSPFRFIAEFRGGRLQRRGSTPVPVWARRFVQD